MSGHSKWSTIKHKKAMVDARRGKMFTKLIRELTSAARAGGGDPEERSRLFRTAWDFVGSALGARTELYERYYLASAARTYALAHIAAQKDREWDQVPAFWAHLDGDGPAHG